MGTRVAWQCRAVDDRHPDVSVSYKTLLPMAGLIRVQSSKAYTE
eukprot:CAMPEP_0206304628 /NCGR_PEP_ID=MMETSP0106_2-20121207/9844_1 /ASSEMBLY_ACC=CAM_ASM_000206 /TAXON_ID=81532 /ORGANISM="Acanthoeca-like sp., Strain 10tr" /LENGTH=43 /DNA_ID= /DNA_START= /DNA_END= /DNA_ORIENTATION=